MERALCKHRARLLPPFFTIIESSIVGALITKPFRSHCRSARTTRREPDFNCCVSGLLLTGFWNRKAGILEALGSMFTFIATVTIIPFMPDGWAPSAGGFPAMVGNVAFLMKDVVPLAVSFYLLKQDLAKVTPAEEIA
nr:DUF417 family protein [Terriglobus albidus]